MARFAKSEYKRIANLYNEEKQADGSTSENGSAELKKSDFEGDSPDKNILGEDRISESSNVPNSDHVLGSRTVDDGKTKGIDSSFSVDEKQQQAELLSRAIK